MNQRNTPTALKITQAAVEAAIADEQYFTAAQGISGARHVIHNENTTGPLARITICVLTLKNGFTAVGVNEGPGAAENFRADLGREYARKKALEKVWLVLGYQLKQQLHETRENVGQIVGAAQARVQTQEYAINDVVRMRFESALDGAWITLSMKDGTRFRVKVNSELLEDACANQDGVMNTALGLVNEQQYAQSKYSCGQHNRAQYP